MGLLSSWMFSKDVHPARMYSAPVPYTVPVAPYQAGERWEHVDTDGKNTHGSWPQSAFSLREKPRKTSMTKIRGKGLPWRASGQDSALPP